MDGSSQGLGPTNVLNEVLESIEAPLRADAAINRDKLLEAARDLFNSGYMDVSLERIAEHAGVGVGTAYRRFPTRAHILLYLFALQLNCVLEEAVAAQASQTPLRAFVHFFYRSVQHFHSTAGLINQLLSHESYAEITASAKTHLLPELEKLIAPIASELRCETTAMDVLTLLLMTEKPMAISRRTNGYEWVRFANFMLMGLLLDHTELISSENFFLSSQLPKSIAKIPTQTASTITFELRSMQQ